MSIFKIRKRNGSIDTFDTSKIYNAIKKAVIAAGGEDFSMIDRMVATVVFSLEERGIPLPDVEMVQDTVEEVLIKEGHDIVAKKYITYRQQRNLVRGDQQVVIDVGKTMDEYLGKMDWRINANANSGYSLGGLILNTAGKVTANYRLSHIYPQEIGNLHRSGDYHIHDLDMFAGYCAGRSLRQLLEEGFNGVTNRLSSSPPRNLQAAINQMINFFGTLQNERAGAQAFSSFDTYLAPFVHKFKKTLSDELDEVHASFPTDVARKEYVENKAYKYVVQQMQNFIFGLNVPSRRGTQTPFTNITLDIVCPDDLRDKALMLGGMEEGYYEKKFGELQEEMNVINMALVEVYTTGDAQGNVFTFPIPTYNITPDFDWNTQLVDNIFAMTAKYGIPYFQNFVGSQFKKEIQADGSMKKVPNPDAYTPGAVRSMCCRLQLDLTELTKRGNGLFGSAEMTGSLGVVTLNLARIGYQHKGDMDGFKKRVLYLMDQAQNSLEIKRKELTKRLNAGLFPYTKRYLASYRNHFSTIGLNGMNEAILNFTDCEEDVTTKRGISFAVEILEMMRQRLKEYQTETGNLYNLEATPAEGATYRFAKEDKKQLTGIIQAGTDNAPYYTNSSQLPVGFTDDCFEALDYQNELQCKYTGGTVLHLYMGERISDAQACKRLVKKVLDNYQLPYITITPTFSICPVHGYLTGEHDYCPKCDEAVGYQGEEKQDIANRILYTQKEYPNVLQTKAL